MSSSSSSSRRPSAPSITTTTSSVSAGPPQVNLINLDPSSKAYRLIGIVPSPTPSPESSSSALPTPTALNSVLSKLPPAPGSHGPNDGERARTTSGRKTDLLLDWTPESSAGSSPEIGSGAGRRIDGQREGKLTALLGLPMEPSLSNLSSGHPSLPSSKPFSKTSDNPSPSPSISSRKHARRASLTLNFGLGFGSASKDKDDKALLGVTSPVASSFKRSVSGRHQLASSSTVSSASTNSAVPPAPSPTHRTHHSISSHIKPPSPSLPSGPLRRASETAKSISTSISTTFPGQLHSHSHSLSAALNRRESNSRDKETSASNSRQTSPLLGSGKGKEREKEGFVKGGSMKDIVGFLKWGGKKDKAEEVEELREEEEDTVHGVGISAPSGLGPLPRIQPRSATTGGPKGMSRSQSFTPQSTAPTSSHHLHPKSHPRRPRELSSQSRSASSSTLSSVPPPPGLSPNHSSTYIYLDSFDEVPSKTYPRPVGISQPDLHLAHALWVARTLSPSPPALALEAAVPTHRLFYVKPGGGTVREARDEYAAKERGKNWDVDRKLDWWFETGERLDGWDFDDAIAARLARTERRRKSSARSGTTIADSSEMDRQPTSSSSDSHTSNFTASRSSFTNSLLTTPTGQTTFLSPVDHDFPESAIHDGGVRVGGGGGLRRSKVDGRRISKAPAVGPIGSNSAHLGL